MSNFTRNKRQYEELDQLPEGFYLLFAGDYPESILDHYYVRSLDDIKRLKEWWSEEGSYNQIDPKVDVKIMRQLPMSSKFDTETLDVEVWFPYTEYFEDSPCPTEWWDTTNKSGWYLQAWNLERIKPIPDKKPEYFML